MSFAAEHGRRGSHLDAIGFPAARARRGSSIQQVPADSNTLHLRDEAVQRASVTNPDFGGLNADAQDATDYETSQTVLQAFKQYKKAVGWSILVSTALVMEGYDFVLIYNIYALKAFNAKFGNSHTADGPTVTANWRSGISNGALVGEILGLWATGYFQDYFGYKKTICGALVMLSCFIFVSFFAQSLGMLLAGEILCGLGWGTFQTITTAYASEVTPVRLRAYLTTYVNLCWVMGQLIGSGVLKAVQSFGYSQWGWRLPFALQWMWPIPLFIGTALAPESPWWLVRHGRYEEAKKSLLRLTSVSADSTFEPDKTIAMIEHTTEIERELFSGTGYLDCFKGVDLRRTEIVCFTWLIQTLCGATFMGYSTVFYQQAGLNDPASYDLSIGQYCLGAVGVFVSWFLMGRFGRRTLYLGGTCILCLLMLIVGFLGIAQDETAAQWAVGSMLLLFTFTYNSTIGPVCYSLIAELSSTRLKAKTIVLARNTFNVGGLVTNTITNYQLSPTAWNWRAYSGFFWAGMCFLCAVWIFFRLPEPKGRTYGEIDILFEHRVSARRFKDMNVSVFRGETIEVRPISSSGEAQGNAEEMAWEDYEIDGRHRNEKTAREVGGGEGNETL